MHGSVPKILKYAFMLRYFCFGDDFCSEMIRAFSNIVRSKIWTKRVRKVETIDSMKVNMTGELANQEWNYQFF